MRLEFKSWVLQEAEGFWSSFWKAATRDEKKVARTAWFLIDGKDNPDSLYNQVRGSKTFHDNPDINENNLENALINVVLSTYQERKEISPQSLDLIAHYVLGTKMFPDFEPPTEHLGEPPEIDDIPRTMPANLFIHGEDATNITKRAGALKVYDPYKIFEWLKRELTVYGIELENPSNAGSLREESKKWALTYFPVLVRHELKQLQRQAVQKGFEKEPTQRRMLNPEQQAQEWFMQNFHQINPDMVELVKQQNNAMRKGVFDPMHQNRKYNWLKVKIEDFIRRTDFPSEVKKKIVELLNTKYMPKPETDIAIAPYYDIRQLRL